MFAGNVLSYPVLTYALNVFKILNLLNVSLAIFFSYIRAHKLTLPPKSNIQLHF